MIQEKAARPVGASTEQAVDVRILSASHKDLVELVNAGQFREDLYYRINVLELKVPSLRERKEDIPELARQIIQSLAERSGLDAAPKLDSSAIKVLLDYDYPGNVRELENILERAIALADNNVIHADDLHISSRLAVKGTNPTQQPAAGATQPETLELQSQEKQAIIKALEKTRWNKTAAAKLLGLSLRQLRYRLEKFNIE